MGIGLQKFKTILVTYYILLIKQDAIIGCKTQLIILKAVLCSMYL